MTPDDPRHGTRRGYGAHLRASVDVCEPCRRAHMRELKRFRLGLCPKLIDATGTRRRIQALMRLGWTGGEIAAGAGGYSRAWPREVMIQPRVTETTADKIAAVYERLSMRVPEGPYRSRNRTQAERAGYLPPLAWDDIDTDPEPPTHDATDAPDPVVVARVLGGEWRLRSTPAEKAEVTRRWVASGRSLRSLRIASGWKVERYYTKEETAA